MMICDCISWATVNADAPERKIGNGHHPRCPKYAVEAPDAVLRVLSQQNTRLISMRAGLEALINSGSISPSMQHFARLTLEMDDMLARLDGGNE